MRQMLSRKAHIIEKQCQDAYQLRFDQLLNKKEKKKPTHTLCSL